MALTKITAKSVKDDEITTDQIAHATITSTNLANDSCTQDKIADEAVDEARLQVSNAGSNGQFLQKQSGDTGGLTWATPTDTNTQVGGDTAVTFNDSVKAKFGTGDDLSVFHSGSENFIRCANTESRLYIDCTEHLRVRHLDTNGLNDESMIYAKGDGAVELFHDGSKKFETTSAGVTVSGTVTDDKGDVRSIPQLSKSSAHTIVASDSGKHSINSTGGWTFNTSTSFTAGQAITLINNSGSDQTITNTGCTMYLGGDTSSKSTLTLKGRGIATFICTASNVYYGSGAGLE